LISYFGQSGDALLSISM